MIDRHCFIVIVIYLSISPRTRLYCFSQKAVMFHSCIVVSALIIFKTWWILLPTCVWCLIITDNSCNYGKQDQMLLTNKSCVPIFLVQPSPDLLTNNFPVNTVKTFRDLNLLQCYLCRLDDNIIDNINQAVWSDQ